MQGGMRGAEDARGYEDAPAKGCAAVRETRGMPGA